LLLRLPLLNKADHVSHVTHIEWPTCRRQPLLQIIYRCHGK